LCTNTEATKRRRRRREKMQLRKIKYRIYNHVPQSKTKLIYTREPKMLAEIFGKTKKKKRSLEHGLHSILLHSP
jgi:hypothetical protein